MCDTPALLGLDRARFFGGYRHAFGSLSQEQVDGLERLLGWMEADPLTAALPARVYLLATVKHETADTFQPIVEYGSRSYFHRYDPVLAETAQRRERARRMGNTEQGDGYRYRGRGYVQLTWKKNYRLLGELLGRDLVADPDQALLPAIAYQILSLGMYHGMFTGRTLGTYLYAGWTDYYHARQVVNGLDRATTILRYAQQFEHLCCSAAVVTRKDS